MLQNMRARFSRQELKELRYSKNPHTLTQTVIQESVFASTVQILQCWNENIYLLCRPGVGCGGNFYKWYYFEVLLKMNHCSIVWR